MQIEVTTLPQMAVEWGKIGPPDVGAISGSIQWYMVFSPGPMDFKFRIKLVYRCSCRMGVGAVYGTHWVFGSFPQSWSPHSLVAHECTL